MIITFARLQRLSGLERPTAIKRWLQKNAIAYVTDGFGQPFTTLEALNARLRYGPNKRRWEPDFGYEDEETTPDRGPAAPSVKGRRARSSKT